MRKYVVPAILAVSVLALVVWAVGTHLQPAVPAKPTGGLISFFGLLVVVAALLGNVKDISELLQGLVQPPSARGSGSVGAAAATALERRNRERMLEKVRAIWITGLLERALPPAARIPLGLEPAAEAVILPFTLEVREVNLPPRPLEPGTPILAVFDQLGGGLLILGQPGAGKTMLLLELARDLIRRAQRDPSQPIPIVLNLSSWSYVHGDN